MVLRSRSSAALNDSTIPVHYLALNDQQNNATPRHRHIATSLMPCRFPCSSRNPDKSYQLLHFLGWGWRKSAYNYGDYHIDQHSNGADTFGGDAPPPMVGVVIGRVDEFKINDIATCK